MARDAAWTLTFGPDGTLRIEPDRILGGTLGLCWFMGLVGGVLAVSIWYIVGVPIDQALRMSLAGIGATAVGCAITASLHCREQRLGPYLLIDRHKLCRGDSLGIALQDVDSTLIRHGLEKGQGWEWEKASYLVVKSKSGQEIEVMRSDLSAVAKVKGEIDGAINVLKGLGLGEMQSGVVGNLPPATDVDMRALATSMLPDRFLRASTARDGTLCLNSRGFLPASFASALGVLAVGVMSWFVPGVPAANRIGATITAIVASIVVGAILAWIYHEDQRLGPRLLIDRDKICLSYGVHIPLVDCEGTLVASGWEMKADFKRRPFYYLLLKCKSGEEICIARSRCSRWIMRLKQTIDDAISMLI